MVRGFLVDYNVVTSTSTSYDIDFSSITVGYNINADAPPYANGKVLSEVQNQTFSNPSYNIQGLLITERNGTLTFDKLRELSIRRYNPLDKHLLLKIDYNTVTPSTYLPNLQGATTGIKVVVKSFNVSFGLDRSGESDLIVGYGTVSLLETR